MPTATDSTASSPKALRKADDVPLEALHDWRPTENAFGSAFRNYEDSKRQEVVQRTYTTMHTKQTVAFAKEVREEWLRFDKAEMTVMEMIALLDNLVDDSDPDNELPNSIHDFQTAERIRQEWPEHDWFHLVGLLHDVGKVLALPEVAGEDILEQRAVVGDTPPRWGAPPRRRLRVRPGVLQGEPRHRPPCLRL